MLPSFRFSRVSTSPFDRTDSPTQGDGVAPASWAAAYFARWKGVAGKLPPPRAAPIDIAWAMLASFVAIAALAAATFLAQDQGALLMITPAFAASAVLLYAAPQAPLSQPRNVVGGHLVGAVVGVAVRKLLDLGPSAGAKTVASALSVSMSTGLMMLLGVTHPPGAASALVPVIADSSPQWTYIAFPALFASCVMVATALAFNNLSVRETRSYPVFW